MLNGHVLRPFPTPGYSANLHSLDSSLFGWLILLLPLGLIAFFIVALIKACRRRTAGWIVAAIVSGIVSFLGLCVLALATFSAKASHSANGPEMPAVNASSAFQAARTDSADGQVSIEFPPGWTPIPEPNKNAVLCARQTDQKLYLMVFGRAKDPQTLSLKAFSDPLLQSDLEKMLDPKVSLLSEESVGGCPAIRYRVEGQMNGEGLVYYATAIETKDHVYFVQAQTRKSQEEATATVLKAAVDSLRFKAGPP